MERLEFWTGGDFSVHPAWHGRGPCMREGTAVEIRLAQSDGDEPTGLVFESTWEKAGRKARNSIVSP